MSRHFYPKHSDLNSFAEAHRLFVLKETWNLEPFMLKGGITPVTWQVVPKQPYTRTCQTIPNMCLAAVGQYSSETLQRQRTEEVWSVWSLWSGYWAPWNLMFLWHWCSGNVHRGLVHAEVSGIAGKMNVLLQIGVIQQEIMCQAVLGQAWWENCEPKASIKADLF